MISAWHRPLQTRLRTMNASRNLSLNDRFLTAVVAAIALMPPTPARACAIAAVSASGNLGADAQRIFISTHANRTDVVVQVTVPQTSEDYGILIPVPSRPTLDTTPVDSAELDALDQATQVSVVDNTNSDSGGGIGCGASDKAGALSNSTNVVETAQIGPLTAVVLTASTGSDLTSWLNANNFVVPTDKNALIDRYSLPGQYFIAAKRNDHVANGAASSLGIHFSLEGEQLGIPLPIAQLGSAGEIAFTIFVAAPEAMGPTGPYSKLQVQDLDKGILRIGQYRGALAGAVSKMGGRAFLLEGVNDASLLSGRLASFSTAVQKISRLSTVTVPSKLTENLMLGPTHESTPPSNYIDVTAQEEGGCRAAGGLASPLAYLAIFAAILRRSKNKKRA